MPLGHPNPYVRFWRNLPWPPPDSENEASRVIAKPVWTLKEVKAIAEKQCTEDGNQIISLNDKCTRDIQKLAFTAESLGGRILELEEANYRNSVWCMRSHLQGMTMRWEQLWFPCDAYALKRREQLDTGWEGVIEYYFKLCLDPGKNRIFLFSVHV